MFSDSEIAEKVSDVDMLYTINQCNSSKNNVKNIISILKKEFSTEETKHIFKNSKFLLNNKADLYIEFFAQIQKLPLIQYIKIKESFLKKPDKLIAPFIMGVKASSKPSGPSGNHRKKVPDITLSSIKRGDYSKELAKTSDSAKREAERIIERFFNGTREKYGDEEVDQLIEKFRKLAPAGLVDNHVGICKKFNEIYSMPKQELLAFTLIRMCGQAKKVVEHYNDLAEESENKFDAVKIIGEDPLCKLVLSDLYSTSEELFEKANEDSQNYEYSCQFLDSVAQKIGRTMHSDSLLQIEFPEVHKEFENTFSMPAIIAKNMYFKERKAFTSMTSNLHAELKDEKLSAYAERQEYEEQLQDLERQIMEIEMKKNETMGLLSQCEEQIDEANDKTQLINNMFEGNEK